MSVTITRPVKWRSVFHPLQVSTMDRLTADAVAVTFTVPAELRETFAFQAGQHVTVKRGELRRSYSICSTPMELAGPGRLRIGVRQVPGGAFSSYATGVLKAGDTVGVLPPLGHFTTAFDATRNRHYAAIVAGSGITPVLSLTATALATEPASRFTLIYGNRYARSVMFVEELGDLKDRYPTRLHLIHVLSREPQEAELLSGRLDEARLRRLLSTLVDRDSVDEWFLCGPYGLVTTAREVLGDAATVHTELFHVEEVPPEAKRTAEETGEIAEETGATGEAGEAGEAGATGEAGEAGLTEVTVVLDGRASTFPMRRDERVLDAALRVRPELPYACQGGVCSTCRAKLVEGEVRMARNYALEPGELAAGYVLTCQASPLADKLTVDYDA